MRTAIIVLACLSFPLSAAAAQMGIRGQMHDHMGMHGQMHGHMMQQKSAATPGEPPAALDRFSCISCHTLHDANVGPAFSWVSWRYRSLPDGEKTLAKFIEHGGNGGHWQGQMPDLGVPPSDAAAIAHWIMSLPPEAPPAGQGGS